MWQHGWKIDDPSPTSPSTPQGGERAGPEVRRAGDLPLHATSYYTLESRPYTLCGLHSKAKPIGRDVGKPAWIL